MFLFVHTLLIVQHVYCSADELPAPHSFKYGTHWWEYGGEVAPFHLRDVGNYEVIGVAFNETTEQVDCLFLVVGVCRS